MHTHDTIDVLDESTRTIRALNDELRTTGQGGETFTTPAIRVMFKVDYYDLDKEWGSSDPADSSVTARVLTILLPDEY